VREEVFEVGTGYGYQTALLARLAARLVSIDIWPDPAAQTRRNLTAQGIGNVEVLTGMEPVEPQNSPRSTRSWSPPPTLVCRRRWLPGFRAGDAWSSPLAQAGRTRRSVPEGAARPAAGADRHGG